MIDVLCCCEPENVIGELPEGAFLPLRKTIDANGREGIAYSSDNLSLDNIRAMPGFEMGKKRKPRKTWR